MSMSGKELDPRLKRILEVAYSIEGVSAARVWQWQGRIALGVRARDVGESELLRRVEQATMALRESGETWDFGVLESDAI
jgi:hypothetical protein